MLSKNTSISCYNPFSEENLEELLNEVENPTHVRKHGSIHDTKLSVNDIINGILKNNEKTSIPESISILINYGTDHSHILYSTANADHNCKVIVKKSSKKNAVAFKNTF